MVDVRRAGRLLCEGGEGYADYLYLARRRELLYHSFYRRSIDRELHHLCGGGLVYGRDAQSACRPYAKAGACCHAPGGEAWTERVCDHQRLL